MQGATSASSVPDLVGKLGPTRTVSVMLSAAAVTEGTVGELGGLLADCDDTYYKDDSRPGKSLAPKGIRYVETGTWHVELDSKKA